MADIQDVVLLSYIWAMPEIPSFNSKLPNVGTTIFTTMSALAHEHGAINLSQGFPNYEIDLILKDLVEYHVKKGHNQYAPMSGIPLLRRRISNKIKRTYGVKVDPDLEITITNGATEALYSSIAAFIRLGDEVIIFEPAYDSYRPAIEVHGGIVVPIKMLAPDYKMDWEAVGDKISDRTKMIIVNSPHNPTGSIWGEEDIKELERLTSGKDIVVLSDEVYQHLTYDGFKHHSVLQHPELRKRSLVAMSFGKTFHATGWRIGYCIAPPELTKEMRKVHQFNTFSINAPMQYALADYLEVPERYESLPVFFEAKRNLFIESLDKSKLELLDCKGTYFILAKYEAIRSLSDVEMAKWLTTEIGVAVIPISVFYSDGTDERIVRFCFAKKEETLIAAAGKLCNL